MDLANILFLIIKLGGGLALFIFGMKIMSDGLQILAGNKLRNILQLLTKNQVLGVFIGSIIAFLIHSSATTTMVSGFINAGLLTLGQSIGIIFGANIGTTFSMQVVSLDFGKYCYLAIAIGFFIYLGAKRKFPQYLGYICLGFGLLFLGMNIMKGAIVPFKEAGYFTKLVAYTNATTFFGLIFGLLISTVATAIMQSSGATIGILFALSLTGVFSKFDQVFPLILGAHIGTCITPILGSIGANSDAKRSAVAHVMFNVLGAVIAIIMFKFYAWAIPKTSPVLTRQIANAHTLIQVINTIIFLPFVPLYIKFVRKITIFLGKVEVEKSHLDNKLLGTPEKAIYAALKEVQRMFVLAQNMLRDAMEGVLRMDNRYFRKVDKDEIVINVLKDSVFQYISKVAIQKLSRRQTILTQFIMNSARDVERIGDHIHNLTELSLEKQRKKVWFSKHRMKDIIKLYKMNQRILSDTVESLHTKNLQNEELFQTIIQHKQRYEKLSHEIKDRLNELIENKIEDPLTSLYFLRFITSFDKIIKHGETVVMAEMNPKIFIRKDKFDRMTSWAAMEDAKKSKYEDKEIDDLLDDF